MRLVYCEFFEHVANAFYREKQVQGWSRKKKQALISGDTNLLHKLAACQNKSHYLLPMLPSAPFDKRSTEASTVSSAEPLTPKSQGSALREQKPKPTEDKS